MVSENNLTRNRKSKEQISVKGSLLLGLLKYMGEKIGAEGRANLLQSLNGEDRAVFFKSADSSQPKNISLAEWYPYQIYKNLINAIIKEVGNGDINLCKEIGYWSAERDLDPVKGVFRFYTKTSFKGDARLVYRTTSIIWKQMYNKGELETEPFEEGKEADFLAWKLVTSVKLKGFPEVTEASCILIGSWMERATQIIGGYETKVKTIYKPSIDVDCEFQISSTQKKISP